MYIYVCINKSNFHNCISVPAPRTNVAFVYENGDIDKRITFKILRILFR